MTRIQMLRDILEYNSGQKSGWDCTTEDGPLECTKKGEPIWPAYCSLHISNNYDYGPEADCTGSTGRYTCSVMQAIKDATGSDKLNLWQLSKRQMAEVHAYLIY